MINFTIPSNDVDISKLSGKELIGQVNDQLTVIDVAEKIGLHNALLCQCTCGNTRVVKQSDFKNGSARCCQDCSKAKQRKINIGDKINDWEVIGHPNKRLWTVRCKCGVELNVQCNNLLGRKARIGCQQCAYKRDTGGAEGTIWCQIRNNARKRKIEILVDWKYCKDLLIKQDYKCAITGIPLHLGYRKKDIRANRTASLDRIDSSKGYVEGNLQWVDKTINRLKNNYSMEEFVRLCTLVYKKSIEIQLSTEELGTHTI
jgi:hypothetical protein